MADAQGIPAHISWLMDLRRQEGKEPVLVQTHISYVVLDGQDVYKFKKPVRFDFIDLTSLDSRHHICEEEVRLNSRLCSELYHGVVAVTRQDTGFVLSAEAGPGEVADYCVHMKRLPAESMLDSRLTRGEVSFDIVGAIAAKMAAFHAEADRSDRVTELGGYETFVRNWDDNFREVQDVDAAILPPATLTRIQEFVRTELQRLEPLMKQREADGHIIDGHGDLRADAIWIDPQDEQHICIFDCLEFNERFRYSDNGLDIGFLAMDLQAKGRPDLAALLIGLYCQSSGDTDLPVLLPLFTAYRAFVRGKVRSLYARQSEVSPDQRKAAAEEAQALFALAASCADVRRPPGMVLVCGLSGSGKSTLAGALAVRTASVVVSTDVARKRLAQARPSQRLDDAAYSEARTSQVYQEVRDLAVSALQRGYPVVVDGTFTQQEQRRLLLDAAGRAGVPLLVVECHVPDEVVLERQERRAAQEWRVSDGSYDVYLKQKAAAEPFDDIPAEQHLVVDTALPLEEQIARVLSAKA